MRIRGLKRRSQQLLQIVVLSPSPSPPCSLTQEEAPVTEDTEIVHGAEAEINPEVEKETEHPPAPLPHKINWRKRAYLGKGKQILPQTKAQLKRYLKFTTKRDKKRCKIVRSQPILACKHIHYPTMEEFKIKDSMLELIDNIG
ncbi:hypothetical protein M9H77_03269 [Catharanthus roseus]|uniref:Uncharacterized protein n=1 Tax=Catharanthus roseus TaxID=4058 RepID=A0ACC0CAS9_CATRO|nr:hypothetical protein M9H77_03269 [Catharanthus roseus]